MNEIIAVLVLTGLISFGVVVLSYRYIMAKMKAEEARWELEREDLVQVDRRE